MDEFFFFFFFQAEDGIRDYKVTGVQTCALPISDPLDPRRDADPPQWVPATQEAAGLRHGTLHRARVQAVPSRGDQAVPQRDALSHREVRGGAARVRARPAWSVVGAAAQGVRVSAPAAREAEGEADLRAVRAAVPEHLRPGAQGARGDR